MPLDDQAVVARWRGTWFSVNNIAVSKFKTTSLNKVKKAPYVSISNVPSVHSQLSNQESDTTTFRDEKIVIVLWVVETKFVANSNWKKQNVLVSNECNEKVVILQRTHTVYIFHILIILSFTWLLSKKFHMFIYWGFSYMRHLN